MNSEIEYVVKADVTAFYQYVDHELLAAELLNISGEYEAIQALQLLLGDLMGRAFGLPQLLDPSDWLSDIYADLIERDMLRRGYAVWRFNDDFRVACRRYPEALDAIEALDDSARLVGLTLNDSKTLTVGFIKYVFDTVGLRPDDEIPQLDQLDVEVVVGDYTEVDDSANAGQSMELIRKSTARVPQSSDDVNDEENGDVADTPNLRRLTLDDFRRLRRALRALAKAKNAAVVADCMALLIYAPSITPDVSRYLLALAETAAEDVRSIADSIFAQVSLSDWQVTWMLRVARATRLLVAEPEWLAESRTQWQLSRSAFLRAEAVLALAEINAIDIEVIESGLRLEPRPMAPWYLAAVEALRGVNEEINDSYIDALRRSDRLYEWLLQDAR